MRVVRADLGAAVIAEHSFEERTEDCRVDLAPVELGGLLQMKKFRSIKVDGGRPGEQVTVDVSRTREATLPVVVAFLIEQLEKIADLLRGVGIVFLEQRLDGRLQRIPLEHPEIFSEETPDQLHGEALDLIDRGRRSVEHRAIELCDVTRGILGQFTSMLAEDRLQRLVLEEQQGVVVLGKLREREPRTRSVRETTRLPDFELLEVAEHDPPGSRRVGGGITRLAPVPIALIGGFLQGDAGSLHLDDHDARPVQVHEARRTAKIFEPRTNGLAIRAVRSEQLVQKGLSLCPLRAGIPRPSTHELGKCSLKLRAAADRIRHRSEHPSLVRHAEVGLLNEPLALGLECVNQILRGCLCVRVSTRFADALERLTRALERIVEVRQHIRHLTHGLLTRPLLGIHTVGHLLCHLVPFRCGVSFTVCRACDVVRRRRRICGHHRFSTAGSRSPSPRPRSRQPCR